MINLRNCLESDLLPCSRLLQQVYSEPPYKETWNETKAIEYLRTFFQIDPQGCFVAVEQTQIVGAIFSYAYPWSSGSIVYIQALFVSSQVRREGVGHELVASAVDAKGRDSTVALIVRGGSAAAKFYEKLGLAKSEHYVVYSGQVRA